MAPSQAATAAADSEARPVRARVRMSATSPAVATSSPIHRPGVARTCWEICTAASPNMTLANIAPPIPPRTCATV